MSSWNVHKAKHSPPPCKQSTHARSDPGVSAIHFCANCAKISTAPSTKSSTGIRHYATYTMRISRTTMPGRRRAFIIRSHAVGRAPGETLRWIQKQLQAMRRQRNSSKSNTQPYLVELPGVIQPMPDTDGPSVQWNDTGTEMNPVATLTKEHPIVVSQGKTVYVALSSRDVKSIPLKHLPSEV